MLTTSETPPLDPGHDPWGDYFPEHNRQLEGFSHSPQDGDATDPWEKNPLWLGFGDSYSGGDLTCPTVIQGPNSRNIDPTQYVHAQHKPADPWASYPIVLNPGSETTGFVVASNDHVGRHRV